MPLGRPHRRYALAAAGLLMAASALPVDGTVESVDSTEQVSLVRAPLVTTPPTTGDKASPVVTADVAAPPLATTSPATTYPATTVPTPTTGAPAPATSAPTTTSAAATVRAATQTPATTPATTVPPTTQLPTTTTTQATTQTRTQTTTPRWSTAPYRGSGAWVDVYDWTLAYTKGRPSVTLASIDRMAALGVETLYLQTSRTTSDNDIDEPERLHALIDRAHANGMYVVAWYLPTMADVETDVRRLLAAAALDVDGLSVNLESRVVTDLAERNRRMVEVSRRVDAALPGEPLGTVILNPFALDVLATHVWPSFPWAELDPYYEVWQPMVYVSFRPAGDPYEDPYLYTQASMRHMKTYAGDEPIHPVTGIADEMTVDGVAGFARAAAEEGAIGGGIYDWATSVGGMWSAIDDLGV